MATLGLSKVFILDKYFTELQKFWETEKKLQDASSSNEAVHLQRRLLSLSSELVTLRHHLHVGAPGATPGSAPAPGPAPAPAAPAAAPPAPQPAVPPRAPQPPPPPPETRWRGAAASVPASSSGAAVAAVGGAASGAAGGDVDDLIHLRGPLTEDAVVRALQSRFYQHKFYTMIGPILVAVNGYTDACNPLTLSGARASGAGELARLVQDAVRHQADSGCPQAIILSGVAGAGKTYASMVLLRRLFDVAGGGPETDAFKHLAAAFTVLRALGAAATPANSNSSRIGHFIEVQVTDGALYRTKIHCYFLEQTRVVRPPPGERNYHIFYHMLAGLAPDERAQLHLDGYSAQELRYLAAGAPRRAQPDDAARFHAWKTCLVILGIPFLDVVRVLAAVLLLGNVQFTEGADGGAEPAADAELAAAAALLGVPAPALLRGLATRRAARAADAARAPATPAAAAAARDALAKALYCRTVATIVRRANSLKRLGSTLGTLSSDSNESVHNQDAASSRRTSSGADGRGRAGARGMAALNDAVRHATDGFVGILDMFGFEEAAPARLEQLCANLCAETMQHFYNTHVFKSSFESCREEGVRAAPELEYADNVPCIDLVSSLRGGLLAALDAECAARGSAERYVARVRAAHRSHPRLADARPPHPRRFAVRHYAAEVQYDATDFLEANRDQVPEELLAAFEARACEFGFATHLFGGELKARAAGGGAPHGHFRASPTAAPDSTFTQDFHTRLDNLLRTLVHARPHFVRCLRANNTETPMLFERATVAKQVRALQILETTQLMASGFPHRMRFRAFATRYRALWGRAARAGEESGAACAGVLRAVAAAAAPPAPASPAAVAWALGKRHVFLSEGMRQVLERMRRARRVAAAATVQAAWRRHRARPRPSPAAPRPRPAPIAGTPPPEPTVCDPALVKRTCSLFGLDLERPPPVPPPRAYTVAGGVKLGYPQQRVVCADWAEDGGAARLRAGHPVLVVGAAGRGHVAVQLGGRTVCVPHAVLAPARAPAPHPPPPAPPHPSAARA